MTRSWILGNSKYVILKNGTTLGHGVSMSQVNSTIKQNTKRTLIAHPRTRVLYFDVYVRTGKSSEMVYESWLGAKRLRSEYKHFKTVRPNLPKKTKK